MLIAGTILGVILILFYTPYLLYKGIRLIGGFEKNSAGFIPVYNLIAAEKLYFGKNGMILYGMLASIISTGLRFAAIFFMTENLTAQMFTLVLMLFSILVFLIGNMVLVFTVINDTKAVNLFTTILYTILYPIGQYAVGTIIPTIAKKMKKENEIAKGMM